MKLKSELVTAHMKALLIQLTLHKEEQSVEGRPDLLLADSELPLRPLRVGQGQRYAEAVLASAMPILLSRLHGT